MSKLANISRNIAITTVVVTAMAVASGHAAIINGDFNKGSGPTWVGVGPAGGGTTWNGINAHGTDTDSFTDLVDSNGNATSVDVSIDHNAGAFNRNLDWVEIGHPDGNTTEHFARDLLTDAGKSDGVDDQIIFSDLTAPSYHVYLFGHYQGGTGTNFTINSVTQAGGTEDGNFGQFVLNEDYVVFNNVVPVNGQIVMDYGGHDAGASGFQLVEVPEPASLALLGLGGLMLVRRRN